MRSQYEAYIHGLNAPGSNKAASYVRALDLLAIILQRPNPQYAAGTDFWQLRSPVEIAALYETALRDQKRDGSIFLAHGLPRSYGANGYYSAALKSYGEFLATRGYTQRLEERWSQVQSMDGDSVSAALAHESGGGGRARGPASVPAMQTTSVPWPWASVALMRGMSSFQNIVKCGSAILFLAGRLTQIWNS